MPGMNISVAQSTDQPRSLSSWDAGWDCRGIQLTYIFTFTKGTATHPENTVTETIPTTSINVGDHFCHSMELPSFHTIAKMYCIDL